MGKKSRLKQEQREQKELEKEKLKIVEYNRRQFLKIGSGALISLAGGIGIYKLLSPPSYIDAYNNPLKRNQWSQNLNDRNYAKIIFADSNELNKLKINLNYVPPEGAFTATIPNDQTKITKGTNSNIYVFQECFNPIYKDVKHSLGKIIENTIKNHELVHADHFYRGIPNFPIEWFYENKNLNSSLFMSVSEVVAYHSEYENLKQIAKDDDFVNKYRNDLNQLVRPYVLNIVQVTKNNDLLGKLRKELWF